jgi:two-component system sensor histidine kinase CpxA
VSVRLPLNPQSFFPKARSVISGLKGGSFFYILFRKACDFFAVILRLSAAAAGLIRRACGCIAAARRDIGRYRLFWKAYRRIVFIIAAMLVLVIGTVEIFFEPLAEALLETVYGELRPWHEMAVWMVSILVSSLVCGYILARALSVKLEKMSDTARELLRGDSEARMPVTDNSRDAFDVLALSFNEIAGSLAEHLQNERRLLADISHELRSPLARMTIAVELLKRGRESARREDAVSRLEKEVTRMSELVSLLLEQGRDRFVSASQAKPVDLGAILAGLAEDFSFQGEAQKKAISIRLEDGLIAHGYPLLLQIMFDNLLSNAFFYTPLDSEVRLFAALNRGKITVNIRDYGPGVPEDQLKDIFRAFYRVDRSRARSSGGAGLGLAIAREAALRHGGSIEAENALPGLSVTVTLPAHSRGC